MQLIFTQIYRTLAITKHTIVLKSHTIYLINPFNQINSFITFAKVTYSVPVVDGAITDCRIDFKILSYCITLYPEQVPCQWTTFIIITYIVWINISLNVDCIILRFFVLHTSVWGSLRYLSNHLTTILSLKLKVSTN